MPTRVAINGFGRIGRLALRLALQRSDIKVVSINSRSTPEIQAHLFTYDSMYGKVSDVRLKKNILSIGGKKVTIHQCDDPASLPWRKERIDVVIESTGKFRKKEDAQMHLTAGAKQVVITAPAKSEDVATFLFGINHKTFQRKKHTVISAASCTTTCLAPISLVLHKTFGIEKGLMTTVHSYTNDQNLLDNSHKKDLRRARAAAENIIPTTTGAATAIGKVIPALQGKMQGIAIRVPTPTVSLVDMTCQLQRRVTVKKVNEAFEKAAKTYLKGILKVIYEPLVSSDFIGDPYASIVDGGITDVIGGNLVKVVSWYDNEWGYTKNMMDFISFIGKEIQKEERA